MTVPSYSDLLTARKTVYSHLHQTPLHPYPGLSDLVGAEVWVKHENHHAVGSFKVRGGVNLAANITDAERSAGLCTASTGNHGQSVAFAGRVTGTPVIRSPCGITPMTSPRALSVPSLARPTSTLEYSLNAR